MTNILNFFYTPLSPDDSKVMSTISHINITFVFLVFPGPLLSDILTNMKKKDAGTLVPDRKMFLYSGHDLTIATMWRTLGFEECLLPEYGAALIIELHSINETEVSEVKVNLSH